MEVNKDQLADILGKSCAILFSDVNIFEEHYYIDVIRDMFDRTRNKADALVMSIAEIIKENSNDK
ncbi:hypothetical protein P4400_004365 [Escherichia coli]|uniref:hypothetical protein n=1 Tax=Escherichia coli TaxID=562 RepID=UPI002927656E|nr:hypothetical protein [Escherichia coli]ELO3327127.1 hypothetical protein [Escherichia coli]ELO3394757.1 hypothetical protein [Escherichia coli]